MAKKKETRPKDKNQLAKTINEIAVKKPEKK
jgi:hypothetical protein